MDATAPGNSVFPDSASAGRYGAEKDLGSAEGRGEWTELTEFTESGEGLEDAARWDRVANAASFQNMD